MIHFEKVCREVGVVIMLTTLLDVHVYTYLYYNCQWINGSKGQLAVSNHEAPYLCSLIMVSSQGVYTEHGTCGMGIHLCMVLISLLYLWYVSMYVGM